jgi:hypothetical protein
MLRGEGRANLPFTPFLFSEKESFLNQLQCLFQVLLFDSLACEFAPLFLCGFVVFGHSAPFLPSRGGDVRRENSLECARIREPSQEAKAVPF